MSLTFVFNSLLIQAASGPNVFTYFAQSNFAGKVVIFILVICSIVAWTVMLGKYLDLSKLRSQNQRYERALSKESHLIALDPERPGKGSGPYFNIVREALGIGVFANYGEDNIAFGDFVCIRIISDFSIRCHRFNPIQNGGAFWL